MLGDADQLALGGHELGRHEVVAGEAVLALEPAGAAAQGEPADPGRGHTPAGGGEPVDLRHRSTSAQVAPPPTRAIRCSASTSTSHMPRRSSTRPSSQSEQPGDRVTAGPHGDAPDRARGRRRAQRSRRRGRRSEPRAAAVASIIELKRVQASAYSGSPGSYRPPRRRKRSSLKAVSAIGRLPGEGTLLPAVAALHRFRPFGEDGRNRPGPLSLGLEQSFAGGVRRRRQRARAAAAWCARSPRGGARCGG